MRVEEGRVDYERMGYFEGVEVRVERVADDDRVGGEHGEEAGLDCGEGSAYGVEFCGCHARVAVRGLVERLGEGGE